MPEISAWFKSVAGRATVCTLDRAWFKRGSQLGVAGVEPARATPPAPGLPRRGPVRQRRTGPGSGTVVDFQTRKPIESFTLTPGNETPDGSKTYWDKSKSKRLTDGRYELLFGQPVEPGHHLLKIEAAGFTPGISRPIADAEGQATIDFRLLPESP